MTVENVITSLQEQLSLKAALTGVHTLLQEHLAANENDKALLEELFGAELLSDQPEKAVESTQKLIELLEEKTPSLNRGYMFSSHPLVAPLTSFKNALLPISAAIDRLDNLTRRFNALSHAFDSHNLHNAKREISHAQDQTRADLLVKEAEKEFESARESSATLYEQNAKLQTENTALKEQLQSVTFSPQQTATQKKALGKPKPAKKVGGVRKPNKKSQQKKSPTPV